MAKNKSALSPKPQNVDSQTWYYEERGAICVVRQIRSPDDQLVQSDMFKLPWRKLEASVKRWRASLRHKK